MHIGCLNSMAANVGQFHVLCRFWNCVFSVTEKEQRTLCKRPQKQQLVMAAVTCWFSGNFIRSNCIFLIEKLNKNREQILQ